VTVIVPVYEDLERLRLCLRLIAAQDYPRELIDVIVVDNASRTDLRPALPVGDSRFRLIREEKKGSYAARNAGLALATGELVAFTDADCRPRPQWLSAAVAALTVADPPHAVGGAIHVVFRDGHDPSTGPEFYEVVHGFPQKSFVETEHFAATANLVVTRAALALVSSFDSDLQSGGDYDWGRRLYAAGGRLEYCEAAIVDHPSRATWRELTAKTVRVAKGDAALTAGQSLRQDLRELAPRARTGITVWFSIWRWDWPPTVRHKASYAATLTWSAALETFVRLRCRLAERIRTIRARPV